MDGHASLGIYRGIEHEDSAKHGQWTNADCHESLEIVEKKNIWRAPNSSVEWSQQPLLQSPNFKDAIGSLRVFRAQKMTKPGAQVDILV